MRIFEDKMINLLPEKQKEGLRLEKNKKLVTVLAGLFLISLVSFSLILFSVRFYLFGERNEEKIVLDSIEEKYKNPEFLSLKELTQKYNLRLLNLDNFYKEEIYFSDVLKNIAQVERPKGLFLNAIVVERMKKDNKIKVIISGESASRESFLLFRDNLNNSQKIENLSFPPEYLLKPTDINFSITFNFKS